MSEDDRHLPQAAAIEAYGKGGFRFADMSHRGSILCLPAGIWAWPVIKPDEIDAESLSRVFAAKDIELFMLGTGTQPWFMPEELRWRFRDARIGVDVMPTGAAVRTYNILFGERRRVGAALIAVD
jgi:uncharacterized protein